MKIRYKKWIQKDAKLNHYHRLITGNDEITHQLFYYGDIFSSRDLEGDISEVDKFSTKSLFNYYLENISIDDRHFETFDLLDYGFVATAYRVLDNDLVIVILCDDEILLLTFSNQKSRKGTIFNALLTSQLNYTICLMNKHSRLIDEYISK